MYNHRNECMEFDNKNQPYRYSDTDFCIHMIHVRAINVLGAKYDRIYYN